MYWIYILGGVTVAPLSFAAQDHINPTSSMDRSSPKSRQSHLQKVSQSLSRQELFFIELRGCHNCYNLLGGLELFLKFVSIQLGMEKSSQLTIRPSFFRGVDGQPPTNSRDPLDGFCIPGYPAW